MNQAMMAECYKCAKLQMEEGRVPLNWVIDKYYTCSKGRYSMGKTYRRWFAWSGIVKPNKTVKLAQTGCPLFQERS